ncbi:hypothetical protein SPTER_22830 [Sporomusa termitida]|uniref:Uncharacterized protein n=2 Tax=Sporomusa termitida TaxID=2377 RepID=A0A517DUA9_9FIRM|nr:hypothetical protein SPTER_22830 [Sporomusa termitida]
MPLLLLLVMYLLPELLKRRKQPKDYEYPDIPEKVPQPVDIEPLQTKDTYTPPATDYLTEPVPKTWVTPPKPLPLSSAPPAVNIPDFTEPVSPWDGRVTPQMVQNGLIFSEIIQPPRAYRPIWRQFK